MAPGKPPKPEAPAAVELLGVEREEKPGAATVAPASADTKDTQTSPSEGVVETIGVKREDAACFGTPVAEAQRKPKDAAAFGKARDQLHEMSSTAATRDAFAHYYDQDFSAEIVKIVFGLEEKNLTTLFPVKAAEIASFTNQSPKNALMSVESSKNALMSVEFTNSRAPVAVWGRKPRRQQSPCLQEIYKFPTPRCCRSRRPSRSSVSPDLFDGKFHVPRFAISGYCKVDSKNKLTVETYNEISKVLKKNHTSALLDIVSPSEDTCSGAKVEEKVGQLRSRCFHLRREVMALGGRPVAEPLAYWRSNFFRAAF